MSAPTSSSAFRVTIFLNGDYQTAGTLLLVDPATMTLGDLLFAATDRLQLGSLGIVLNRAFTQQGHEIRALSDLYPGDQVYLSVGEDFITPEEALGGNPSSTTEIDDDFLLTDESNRIPTDPNASLSSSDATSQGYLSSALLLSAKCIQSTYSAFSNIVMTQCPASFGTALMNTEKVVSDYTTPAITVMTPALAKSIEFSDVLVDKLVQRTCETTSAFLETPTGQGVQTQVIVPIQQFSTHAVESLKQASTLPETQIFLGYMSALKSQMGELWSNNLIPLARVVYNDLRDAASGIPDAPS